MTLAKANTDPPEWTLYDNDLITPLRVLIGMNPRLYLKMNETGSGELTLPLTAQNKADIILGRMLVCNYRGAIRGGFIIENIVRDDIASQEYTGRVIKFSGRGFMAILDDACVADWGTPDAENVRKFGTYATSPLDGAPVPKGYIIHQLLHDARDNYSRPDDGLSPDRYCWHVGSGVSFGVDAGTEIFDWDFDGSVDSNTDAWTDAEDIELRVGMSLLDVMRQFAALELDFTIDFTPQVGFLFHAYKARIGTDLTDTIFFRAGKNCIESSYAEFGADIRNQITIELSDPITPFTEVFDNLSLQIHRRRESFLSCADATTLDTALRYGDAELILIKDSRKEIDIKASDAITPMIFVDYSIGDTISYDDGFGTIEELRITGALLSWTGDNPYADVILEIGNG